MVDRGLDTLEEEKQDRSGPCRVSRTYAHQPSVWAASGALWVWYAPMGHVTGHSDDDWRAFVRRRGRGPSLRLWLRVWIRKWLWLNFCVWHVTRRVSVFFNFYILSSTLFLYFIFTFIFIFYLQNEYRQIVHVLHLNPRFFFADISFFDVY
jgi:hypothetical protein